MAKKISQLTQATQVKSDDVTVIVQDGETKKLPLNMMVTKQDIENKKVAGLAKLDEIEATYENDTYTPTIAVKNKSSVKVGEGDGVDYSANVMDGHVKSAILSGRTEVTGYSYNGYMLNNHGILSANGELTTLGVNGWSATDSLIKLESGEYYIEDDGTSGDGYTYVYFYTENGEYLDSKSRIDVGVSNTFNIDDLSYVKLSRRKSSVNNLKIYRKDDLKLTSVKVPVLKTTGKNLLDSSFTISKGKELHSDGTIVSAGGWAVEDFMPVTFRGDCVFSSVATWLNIAFYTEDKTFISIKNAGNNNKMAFTVPENAKYFRVSSGSGGVSIASDLHYQIEQGAVSTTYEPFKSNILSTSEDVELRGIGGVRDELDLLTGEVTERIGEIVLDGSEEWQKNNTDVISFYYRHNESLSFSKIITDNYPIINSFEDKTNGIFKGGGAFGIIKNDIENVEQLKQWLSQNPITVQYQLATESIKTVDLIPSGTHPSTTPYCWKDGHIQLSSSGLLPSLEYSVVTSRAGQINQNATMIVKNDKRIFDLEILLAGGLVNTTYQALTLQNQVETGLSKVSLSSETEPDYLLYHMIMKLIEEKAYKLDDLTEKVSVFYLYEKLSDEQFETIYSALYPFVEDEIIEEPVVEELPEVVENEVVM